MDHPNLGNWPWQRGSFEPNSAPTQARVVFAFRLAEEKWRCVWLGGSPRGVTIMGATCDIAEPLTGKICKDGVNSHIADT